MSSEQGITSSKGMCSGQQQLL